VGSQWGNLPNKAVISELIAPKSMNLLPATHELHPHFHPLLTNSSSVLDLSWLKLNPQKIFSNPLLERVGASHVMSSKRPAESMDEMENDTEGGAESDAKRLDTKLQPEMDVLIAGDGSELPADVPAPPTPIEIPHEERVAAWKLAKAQDYVKYAQKILQNPLYASGITSTELRFQDHDPEWGLLDISLFSEDDWSCLRESVKSLALTTEEEYSWMAAIRSGHWDALVAAVLPLLRNLTELSAPEVQHDCNDLEGNYTWIRKIIDRVTSSQEDGDTTRALLPKLKSVSLAWNDTENGMDFNDVLLFAQVKSVEYLKAFAVSDEGWPGSDKELHLNLKSVELEYSRVDMDSLGSFLECCPKLETFSYEEGGSTVGFGWFEACKLGLALASIKDCLRELKILDDYTPAANPDCDWDKPMGPVLVDFPKLEKLHVMAIMLVGEPDDGLGSLSDISAEDEDEDDDEELREPGFKKGILVHSLPRGLKELRLENCPEELFSELEELCKQKDGEVPWLEIVELDTWAGHDLESHKRLSAKFEAKGVKLISRVPSS
jgi:hypothetical protein